MRAYFPFRGEYTSVKGENGKRVTYPAQTRRYSIFDRAEEKGGEKGGKGHMLWLSSSSTLQRAPLEAVEW